MPAKRAIRKKRRPIRTILIAAVIAAVTIGGTFVVQAQDPSPIPSLKTVKVPEPDNLGDFVKDRAAAIRLGKALFWDMQVGSDGIQSCGTCHFNAGADSRSKNQLSPGLNHVDAQGNPTPDYQFDLAPAANYQLTETDFPFHQFEDPLNRNSAVTRDTSDVASSQGVFFSNFKGIVPGQAEDSVSYEPDPEGFQVDGVNVRRVEPRNTPTMINAVFNVRNFWDGRAQAEFNGVNHLGTRDKNAFVYIAKGNKLEKIQVSLNNSSLASQAVAPPLSGLEMSANGRTFEKIGEKFSKSKPLLREQGRKILRLRPLAKQLVHPEDSVLGTYSRSPQPGLDVASYEEMIKAAFKPEWWRSNKYIAIDSNGVRTIVNKKTSGAAHTQMEYNFSLFFGLAVQMYEATLVSDDSPFDRFAEGDHDALDATETAGLTIFATRGCTACHNGPEFTNAAVTQIESVTASRISAIGGRTIDTGFFNLAVRPTREDPGLGAKDPFGNPLSEARLAGQPDTATPAIEGAFKAPGLRNVELTAPYMHNGGMSTLEQVLEFYFRGGDFIPNNTIDGTIRAHTVFPIALNPAERAQVIAFLKALTDERVPLQKAPFDHPQLFVPNGHPGDHNSVVDDGTGKATDELLEIPAVGRNGGAPLKKFLEP